MVRSKFSIVVYAIIGLAVLGLASQLFNNPLAFFRNILIMIGITVIIFAIFYFIFIKGRANIRNDEMKKYKQAVKQSKRRYNQTNINQVINNKTKRNPGQLKRKSKRRASHLRVIDGTGRKQNIKNEPHIK